MGLGIQGAFGAMGAQQTLQQILASRRAEQMMAEHQRQQDIQNSQRDRQLSIQETAAQPKPAPPERPMSMNPGSSLVEPSTGRIITSIPAAEKPAVPQRPISLAPGGSLVDPGTGRIITSIPDRAKPEPTGHFSPIPQYDESGKPIGTMSFDTHSGRTAPMTGQDGKPILSKQAPGAAQAMQASASKHEALGSLQQLDQAIEEAKDLIGPGAGRISSIQQMVGNPNPKIAALGTKMLLAKMQVDHAATGTVRAGASPQILARWDNILGNNQDAASLKASVQAMREILGGGSGPTTGGGTVSMVAPDGRALNVPADKVAELEAAGAKRK